MGNWLEDCSNIRIKYDVYITLTLQDWEKHRRRDFTSKWQKDG